MSYEETEYSNTPGPEFPEIQEAEEPETVEVVETTETVTTTRSTDQEREDARQAELQAARDEHNRRVAPGGAELPDPYETD